MEGYANYTVAKKRFYSIGEIVWESLLIKEVFMSFFVLKGRLEKEILHLYFTLIYFILTCISNYTGLSCREIGRLENVCS